MDYYYKKLNNVECIRLFLFLSILVSYVECSKRKYLYVIERRIILYMRHYNY